MGIICKQFVVDPYICDDVGEPKGQCANCGNYHDAADVIDNMKCIHHEPRSYCKRSDGCRDCDEQLAVASASYEIRTFKESNMEKVVIGNATLYLGDCLELLKHGQSIISDVE